MNVTYYKNFLQTSSLAKDIHSSTVSLPSFLGSYFLNKASYSSLDGVARPCFTGVAKNSCIMDGKVSFLTNPVFSKSCSVKISKCTNRAQQPQYCQSCCPC